MKNFLLLVRRPNGYVCCKKDWKELEPGEELVATVCASCGTLQRTGFPEISVHTMTCTFAREKND